MLEIDERALGPQTLTQLVASDDLAGPLEHEPENLERLLLQTHARAAAAQFARPHVELEVSEPEDLRGLHADSLIPDS